MLVAVFADSRDGDCWMELGDVPGVCYDDVVEGGVLLAEAGESDS